MAKMRPQLFASNTLKVSRSSPDAFLILGILESSNGGVDTSKPLDSPLLSAATLALECDLRQGF